MPGRVATPPELKNTPIATNIIPIVESPITSETTGPTSNLNRRSTLMGEKGFGLGVCGTWDFYERRV